MKLSFTTLVKSILSIKVDKKKNLWNWGLDNLHPQLIESLIELSVTAGRCTEKAAKAIYGGGLETFGDAIVNKSNETLNELLRQMSREFAKHNNCFLHVSYDGNLNVSALKVIPCTKIRVGKSDDRGYSGKYLICNDWAGKAKQEDIKIIDSFSKSKKVLESQIETAGGIMDFEGQILHIQKDNSRVYSYSDLDLAKEDAETEYNSKVFRNRGTKKGFLNTKLLVLPSFANETDRKQFKKTMQEFQGVENAGDVMLLEIQKSVEDLTKQFEIKDLSGSYNDKLFAYSDSQSMKSICAAFGVPPILISQSDKSLFGNSGELLKQAKIQLYEEKQEERNQILSTLNMLVGLMDLGIENLNIINPYEVIEDIVEVSADEQNQKAQATLRGSVGGVTSLLAIQQSVAAGTTTKDAGIAIIVNIYGFTEDQASDMLGDPKTETEVINE